MDWLRASWSSVTCSGKKTFLHMSPIYLQQTSRHILTGMAGVQGRCQWMFKYFYKPLFYFKFIVFFCHITEPQSVGEGRKCRGKGYESKRPLIEAINITNILQIKSRRSFGLETKYKRRKWNERKRWRKQNQNEKWWGMGRGKEER